MSGEIPGGGERGTAAESPPAPAAGRRSLGARAMSGFGWSGLSAAANVVFQLGLTAALARLLRPADFGLMAMCGVAVRFFSYFSQLGLAAALVQRPRVDAQDIRCALGFTWLVCGAAAILLAAAAPALGWFFRNPAVVPVVRVLSLNLLLLGLGGVSMALLRRELRFREQALVETTSYVVGFGVVGVVAAWSGAGVWSLVAATFGQSVLYLGGGWAVTRHPVLPSLRGDRGNLLGYGARQSIIGFVEFLGGNADSAIVGRLLGESALGLYNRATMLTNQPVERAAGILSRVLFPLIATVQGQRQKVGGVFLLGLAIIGVFGGAVSLGLSAAAAEAVRVVLGPGWGESVGVIQVLALAVPLMFMSQVAGVVCDALALLRFKLILQSSALGVILAAMIAFHRGGVRGIAWAIVVGELLRFCGYLAFLPEKLQCARRDVARVLFGVVSTSALSYACCRMGAALAQRFDLAPVPALLVAMAGGVVALCSGAWLMLLLLDGTAPARLAEASVPGWERLRSRLRVRGAGA